MLNIIVKKRLAIFFVLGREVFAIIILIETPMMVIAIIKGSEKRKRRIVFCAMPVAWSPTISVCEPIIPIIATLRQHIGTSW
jgi:hypothetical protein